MGWNSAPAPPPIRPAWMEPRPSDEACYAIACVINDYFAKYPTDDKSILANRSDVLAYARNGMWSTVQLKLWQVELPEDVQQIIEHSMMLLDK